MLLVNQLEIRKAITKSNQFDEAIEILENGYEMFYSDVGQVFEETLSADDCKFVVHVLSMYRAIEDFKSKHPTDTELANAPGAYFVGFDGNNETKHMSFTKFLVYTQRKFQEQLKYVGENDNFNSHWESIPRYAKMLEKWNQIADKGKVTREQILSVLARGG